jgi:hypothetical protein
MFMTSLVALESLDQRGKTPFFLDLIKLYQESFDDVAKLKTATSGDIVLTLKAMNFKDRVRKIFLKHMGISLSRVTVEEAVDPNLVCWLLCSPVFDKTTKIKSSGQMMTMIDQLYNNKTGKYDNTNRTAQAYRFGLSVYTSLWTLKNKDGSFYLTAEELAAATLHEAGHVDHFIRNSKRVYADTVDASEIVDYVYNNPDKEVILKLLAGVKQSKYLDKSWQPVIGATEAYFTTSNSLDSKEYYEALTTLCALVTSEIADFSLAQFNNTYHILGPAERVVETRLINVDVERSADEFAVRNGAYHALTTMLGKLTQLTTTRSSVLLKQFMWSSPATLAGYLTYFTSLFNVAAEDIANGYDPLIRRLELIVETAKHAFSNLDLSDELKEEFRQQIIESEKYIKMYKSTNHQLIRSRLKSWKEDIGRFGRIIASPVQNRLTQDYERLQDANRSLSRHSLYYLANK